MEENEKLRLFISYSHKDNLEKNPFIDEFNTHIAPLRNNNLIEVWYDREILPGENIDSEISDNLEDADIICLFISANFLDSDYCMKEKTRALELQKTKGTTVVPIIVSFCGWQDCEDISKLLALPEEGKPISEYSDQAKGWHNVYTELKRIIEKEKMLKQLNISEKTKEFLQDVEMLSGANSRKGEVILDDIFVYPELEIHNISKEEKIRCIESEILLNNLLDYPKVVIAGEDQSGKTTLCKILFKELSNMNFVPVYINDAKNKFERDIRRTISSSFREQYKGVSINEIDEERIVPIIDDFHYAKNKERHIKHLSRYPRCIIFVDDIFGINIRDDKLIRSFTRLTIKEFKPSLRYDLISKWVNLTDVNRKEFYKNIDKRIKLMEDILGRTIGKGIMPSYPFFILAAVVSYDNDMPLDKEITSQGYCYQSLIYFYLRSRGVSNDEIDIYINFLTELAFYFYDEEKEELSPDEFGSFMDSYSNKFYVPIDEEILIENLNQIFSQDSFNNYSFKYPYFYFFFAAKYLAEHLEDNGDEEIKHIMENLHVNENAYIAVFLAHHSRNTKILNEIEGIALSLFNEYEPATLSIDELEFFDKQADIIIKESLPSADTTPEKERKKRLDYEDKMEARNDKEKEKELDDGSFEMEFRRAVKTVEVIGCIIKNRAGSIEKTKLECIFKEAMNVHLKILSHVFEILKNENVDDLINFMSKALKKIVEKGEGIGEPSDEELKTIARFIFWNINFLNVYGIIYKAVQSLGSDKLTKIASKVCDEVNTPASFVIKHGILMWFAKNPQLDELAEGLKDKNFSEISKKTVRMMVAEYCFLHEVTYGDLQRIADKLAIPQKTLLVVSREAD